jgi:hypothetical protein
MLIRLPIAININPFGQSICKLTTTQLRTNNKAADNSRFAKAGVWCFYDSEVLNSSFVHLMKFSAENPRLRQAPKRYGQV